MSHLNVRASAALSFAKPMHIAAIVLAAAIATLPLSAAFAEGEGTYRPTVYAAQDQGPAVDNGVGQSFVFDEGQGGVTFHGVPALRDSSPSAVASVSNKPAGSVQGQTGTQTP